jgi:hypothetical protein
MIAAVVSAGALSFELSAVMASSPPVIDGAIADEEWAGAALAKDFVQYAPRGGKPSDVRTEALVLYDAGHLYVAFRAWDPLPPTGQLTRRDDDLFADDAVIVLLDSAFDRQTAFYFMTNVLGTQADARVSDDGRVTDTNWDAPWQAAAQRTEFGFSAEIAIPFTSIKYAAGEGRTWGLNLGRSRRRSLELSFWAGPLDNPLRVSQAGRLSGLNVPPPADRFQVIPYGLSQLQEGSASDWQAGGDLRFALTPQLAVYATVNPDFATVEADQEVVNLTRFEISLPEKRQFFLEGNELFQQRVRTFYSRRITDIAAGGKLLGRQGPWTLAFLTVESEPLEEEASEKPARANYAVARVQRDVLGRSYVALMAANRRFEGLDQGSVGLDSNLFFSDTWGMTGQLIQSYGAHDDGSLAFFARPSYDSPTGHFHVRYTHLGDRFRDNVNVIGFVQDDDRRELDSAVEKTLWLAEGAVERVFYDSNYNIYWSQTGVLRSWEIRQSLETDLRNRWSAEASCVGEFKRFEKDFHNHQLGMEIGYNTREYQSVTAGLTFGRNFDSDFKLWTATARYKVTDALSAEYELQRLTLDPDPEHESTWIHVVRASQFFTKDLFLRVFFQTNTAIDRSNVQAVFVYRYRPPFGTLQLAYQRGTAEFGQRSEQGNTLFLKVTAVF